MNILILSSTVTQYNSVGKITTELAAYLENKGNHVRLLYLDSVPSENGKYIPVSSRLGMKIYYQVTFLSHYRYHFQPWVIKRIDKNIREFKPDIVQLIQPLMGYIDYAALFRLIGRHHIPCVYTMIDEYAYLGGCDNAYDCKVFYSGCDRCGGQNAAINREDYQGFWNQYACRSAARIKRTAYGYVEDICFAAPEWVVRRAQSSFLLRGRQFYEVDEYVNNASVYYPRALSGSDWERAGIDQNKIMILNVARYSNVRKGMKYFMELARRLESDERFLFVNIGYDGEPDGLPSNYKAIPFVKDQNELAKYYTMSDLYMITSLSDTMPNVCLEALSCGTPVCGFHITGIPYVAEEPLGVFVEAGDIDALARVVRGSGKKSGVVSERCRAYALKRYSPDVYGEKMTAIYKKMKK